MKIVVVAIFVALFAIPVSAQTDTLPAKLVSPDKQVEISVALADDGAPMYTVSYKSRLIIAPSRLGLDLKQGGPLSKGMRVVGVRRDSHDERYPLVVGKAHEARDHYEEMTVSLEEKEGARRKVDLVFRAYDDGAAFRYRLPSQPGLEQVEVSAERSEFRFPTDQTIWAAQYGSFTTSQETEFDRITTNRLSPNSIVGLPLLSRTRDESVSFALAEADLDEYAGLYFSGLPNGYGVMSRLATRRDDPNVAVRTAMKDGGVRTPWRVVMLASEPEKLIESTIVQNLNPPNAIGDASWVKPGRSAWDWWSGPARVGLAEVGMNDATMKHYIDFAGEMGLEYMLVDAGWYSKLPGYGDGMDLKADITKTIPEIDLPGLIEYAKAKNVGIWVWVHWRLANDQMDAAFPFYEKLGVRGVKIDFMDSDDQEMVAFYHRVLKKAAEHHLMIDLHGAYKPTGLTRTFPNYVTQEGVMGAEYNKWSARITATHNVTLAFTRLLVGPMDYTPGAFRNRSPREFTIRGDSPEVMTTRAHQLAMYVVYESPFACVSDNPEAYKAQKGAEFLKTVPTSWDETRALAGEIGEYVVVARRKGNEWYLGAMTNERAREVEVPLAFLGNGRYRATMFGDGAQPSDVAILSGEVAGGKINGSPTIRLRLGPSGGAAIRFTAQ